MHPTDTYSKAAGNNSNPVRSYKNLYKKGLTFNIRQFTSGKDLPGSLLQQSRVNTWRQIISLNFQVPDSILRLKQTETK